MLSKYLFSIGLLGLFKPLFAEEAVDRSPTSVFILPVENDSANYTFALNIPSDGYEDVYFHLSGPASFSWIAVGTGTEMEDSLMFDMYVNTIGNGVTLSPRLCSGHSEPVFESSLDVEMLPGTGLSGNLMTVNARCSNCRTWKTGSLDVNSTAQPWIYALGANSVNSVNIRSDSVTAGIERHSIYGRFIMDMLHAAGGSGNLPTSYTTAGGSAEVGNPSNDSNWPSIIHALATTAAFILLMPAGIVLLRVVPESVRWHWINQSFALGLAALGGAIGLYLGSMFSRSESYNSPHQILGLIAIALLFGQWGLGFWHHRAYKRTRRGTKYGPIHRWLGRGVMVLAVVTGGIGLTWSYASTRVVIGYIIVVAVLLVAVIISLTGKRWIIRKRRMLGGSMNNWSSRRCSESQVHLTDYADPTGTVKLGRLELRDVDDTVG